MSSHTDYKSIFALTGTISTIFFLLAALTSTFEPMPAGTRPNQLDNLVLWVKADSLGKTYAGDAQVDSMRDWANVGEWFTQATAGNRPLYRTNVSPTGLPGVDFDGSDDFLTNASSTTLYNDFHGTSATIFVVFLLDGANEVQAHWHNNAGSSNNIGSFIDLDAEGNFVFLSTHAVPAEFGYNFSSTQEFDQLDSVYYATILIKSTPDDTLVFRMNGVRKGSQTGGIFTLSNASLDAVIGHASAALNGKILEIVGFSDTLTDGEVNGIELYILDKWIAAQVTTRGRVIVIQQ